MISGLACQNCGTEAQHWFECYMPNELLVYCPPQSSDQDLYASIMQIYPKIKLITRLGSPVSPGCRMPKSYSVGWKIWSFCIFKSLDKTSEIIGNFPTLLSLRLCFGLFVLFVSFFPSTGVTCPGPGSWVIFHDITPDLSCGLGRWQVFWVIWFCANEEGSTIKWYQD